VDLPYALAALALGAASAVLGLLASAHRTFPLDAQVGGLARDLGTDYGPIAEVFNDGYLLIPVAAVAAGSGGSLILRRQLHLALLFPLVLSARPLLNVLKTLVDRPRPAGDFAVLDNVNGSSFPSGHVMNVEAVFGLWFVLAPYLLPRPLVLPARLVAVSVIALTALSRIWAGVHWLSDGYGGVLWAMTLVTAVMAIRPALRTACRHFPRLHKVEAAH
jgi:membrane-associated phospholipid phosphatase